MRTVFANSTRMLCSLVFTAIQTISGAGDFAHVRETAPHYWKWSQAHASQYFSKNELVEGVATGDAHILNLGYSFVNKKYQFTLQDIDGVGYAPLLLDFARLVVSSKALNSDISTSEMLEAYHEGLQGKKPEPVSKIKDEFDEKPEWDVKKLEELDTLNESSAQVRALYKSVENDLLKSLNVSKFADVRVRIKDTGGSKGLVRFWVLTSKNQVYEFKTLVEPPTQYWRSQSSAAERYELAENNYRNGGSAEFKVVDTEKGPFFLRPRYKEPEPVEDLVDENPSSKQLNKYSLFVAQALGVAHGKQSGGKSLEKILEENFDSLLENLKEFRKAYIEDLESQ